MSLKGKLDDIVDFAVDRIEDAKDSVNEALHRGEAQNERAKRDVAGDVMTPGEKVGSVFNEAKNETQANLDKTKREVRDNI